LQQPPSYVHLSESAKATRSIGIALLTNPNFVEVINSRVNETHQVPLSWLDRHLETLSATLRIDVRAIEEDVVGHIRQRSLGGDDNI
jgi:hypothetical protein